MVSSLELVEREEPEIAGALGAAPDSQLRQLATMAAEEALRSVELHAFVPLAAQGADRLEKARATAESEYWRLHSGDDGPGPMEGVDAAFARERALTAACATFLADPLDAAASAVYESLYAVSDRGVLRALLLSV